MAGLLIVYLLVLNSDEGALILDEAFGKERCGAYIHVLELLLMVENFCKQESHELLQLKIIKTGIPYIMNTIKEVLDRKDGQGWKIPKFHLMTHFADDVYRFGSMRNFDSATGERNHKTEVKDPAQHTQRRKDEFEMQTADRYYENLLIQLAGTDLGLTGYWDKKIATEKEDNVDKCQNIYYCHKHKNLFKHKDRRLQPCDWKDETFKKQLIELCYALVQTGHLNSPIRFLHDTIVNQISSVVIRITKVFLGMIGHMLIGKDMMSLYQQSFYCSWILMIISMSHFGWVAVISKRKLATQYHIHLKMQPVKKHTV